MTIQDHRKVHSGRAVRTQTGWVELADPPVAESCIIILLRIAVSLLFWFVMIAGLVIAAAKVFGYDLIPTLQTALFSAVFIPKAVLPKVRLCRWSVAKMYGGWVIYDRQLARAISSPMGDPDKSSPEVLQYGIDMAHEQEYLDEIMFADMEA
jgi:hypothetical protein